MSLARASADTNGWFNIGFYEVFVPGGSILLEFIPACAPKVEKKLQSAFATVEEVKKDEEYGSFWWRARNHDKCVFVSLVIGDNDIPELYVKPCHTVSIL